MARLVTEVNALKRYQNSREVKLVELRKLFGSDLMTIMRKSMNLSNKFFFRLKISDTYKISG